MGSLFSKRAIFWLVVSLLLAAGVALTPVVWAQLQKENLTQIPETWDPDAIASIEVPLADAKYSPTHISKDYYYRIPARRVFKSYPVYAPGREPKGYWEWLKQQEPELAFDPIQIKSQADWIKAGEQVFEAPVAYDFIVTIAQVRD